MIAHGTLAYFVWEVKAPAEAAATEGAAMSVAVSVDGSTAQSLTVDLRR